MDQIMLAVIAASSQPQPRTGLMCSLMAPTGRRPVESVTYAIALSMTTPRIIASGWSHRKLNPTSVPRYRHDDSDPPPSVMPLWSQPGPESLMKALNIAPRPLGLRVHDHLAVSLDARVHVRHRCGWLLIGHRFPPGQAIRCTVLDRTI